MTDEATIKAVTAKLAGEFYVGQRVQIGTQVPSLWNGYRGVITIVQSRLIEVKIDGYGHMWFYAHQIFPL